MALLDCVFACRLLHEANHSRFHPKVSVKSLIFIAGGKTCCGINWALIIENAKLLACGHQVAKPLRVILSFWIYIHYRRCPNLLLTVQFIDLLLNVDILYLQITRMWLQTSPLRVCLSIVIITCFHSFVQMSDVVLMICCLTCSQQVELRETVRKMSSCCIKFCRLRWAICDVSWHSNACLPLHYFTSNISRLCRRKKCILTRLYSSASSGSACY